MSEPNPTITVGRSMVIDGRTYTAQQVVYPDTAPYYEILCPDGLSIDDADPYDHPPTDADFHEIAGIYVGEVLPALRNSAAPAAPATYTHYDIYGAN